MAKKVTKTAATNDKVVELRAPKDRTSKALLAALRKAATVDIAIARETEKKTGIYTLMMGIANDTDSKVFNDSVTLVASAIKNNAEGCAVKAKCKPSEKTKGQYCLPSAFSSAKSVIKNAYKHGVAFVDDEGEIRPFTQVRAEVQTAQADEARDKLSPECKTRDELKEVLREVTKELGSGDIDAVQAARCGVLKDILSDWLQEYREPPVEPELDDEFDDELGDDADVTDAELEALQREIEAAEAVA